ncbi:hypothetical protein [Nocardia sp. NBC_01009]|uniref:hypothetical protein n=1 Tax=Nocardia sp. NBC_01009 TaxID=2975996 RepID=UPI0038704EF8|nr:hypothetical protein OHA42_05110 [Nocardia sp. NBC_01009]
MSENDRTTGSGLVRIVDEIAGDRDSTPVSRVVAEIRRRGLDPAELLDADFLIRG